MVVDQVASECYTSQLSDFQSPGPLKLRSTTNITQHQETYLPTKKPNKKPSNKPPKALRKNEQMVLFMGQSIS